MREEGCATGRDRQPPMWDTPRLPLKMTVHAAQQAVNHLTLVRRMMSACRADMARACDALPEHSEQRDQYVFGMECMATAMAALRERQERIRERYMRGV